MLVNAAVAWMMHIEEIRMKVLPQRFTREDGLMRRIALVVVMIVVTAASIFARVAIPVPSMTFLSPVSAPPGGADFTLIVNGANFVNGISVVNWSGTPLATRFVSHSQLTATVPAALTASEGTGWITVSNSGCGLACKVPTSNVIYFPVVNATSAYTAVQMTAAVGNQPRQLTEADFNNDGMLDLAVSNYSDNTVSILLGNGDGTFQPQTTFSTLAAPFGIAVGDLNDDGIPDLVVGNDSNGGGLNICLGDGSGGFTAGTSLSGQNCPREPILVDLNDDGKLDIVVGSACGLDIEVYLGLGNGTFAAPMPVTMSSGSFGMVVADFNGDGILDLAAADYTNNAIDIYLGMGGGIFGVATQLPGTTDVIRLATGDFNRDGNVDLLAASASSGIYILYGNGDGTFQAPTSLAGAGGVGYFAVAAADLNGDGNPDIVATDSNGATKIWFSASDGSFQSSQVVGNSGIGYALAMGNFVAGGALDIAATSNSTNQVKLYLPTIVISPSSENFGSVAVGSFVQQTLTIANDASTTVTISGISLTGANPGDFSENNTCSSPLPTAGTCTVTVTFAPTAAGQRTATLTVTDDAPGSPQTASLTGTGFLVPLANLSPAALAFGNQTIGVTSSPQPVTLSNSGNGPLNIASIGVAGANARDFGQMNNCPGTLNTGAQCIISVTFKPSLVGAESASLQFSDNSANSPQQVPLGGTGVNPPPNYSLTANPTSMTIEQGHSASTLLTITPVGGMTGTVTFSCTGLPEKSSCAFAPTQVVLSGNNSAANVTMTVHTTGPNGVLGQLRPSLFPWISSRLLAVLIFPAGLAFAGMPGLVIARKKHRRSAYLGILLLLAIFAAIGMTGCGAISSPSTPSPGQATPTGQYSVTAVASLGGSNTRSTVVTVTVTK